MAGIFHYSRIRKAGVDKREYSALAKLIAYCFLILLVVSIITLIAFEQVSSAIHILNHHDAQFFAINYTDQSLQGFSIVALYGVLLILCISRARHSKGNLMLVVLNLSTLYGILLGVVLDAVASSYIGSSATMPSYAVHSIGVVQYLTGFYRLAIDKYICLGVVFIVALFQALSKHSFTQRHTSGKFGSARFADLPYLRAQNLTANKNNSITFAYGKLNGQYIGSDKLVNRLVLAPPGEGKSASICIPLLLDSPYNMASNDVKAELFLTTYKRRIELGKDPRFLDPFNYISHIDNIQQYRIQSLNPLAREFDNSADRERYLTALTQALMIQTKGDKTNNHFEEAATAILKGLLDAYLGKGKTLVNLYKEVVLAAKDDFVTAIENLQCSASSSHLEHALVLLKDAGKQGEQAGMKTTLMRSFEFLASDSMQAFFDAKDIGLDPQNFVQGNQDIFIVMPPMEIEEYPEVPRIIITMLGAEILRTNPANLQKHYGFLLDELGQLSYFPLVEKLIEVARAWGVAVIAAFQSPDQIALYQKPKLLKQASVKHFFANDDVDTMDWIKRLCGNQTIETESQSDSQSQNQKTLADANKSIGNSTSTQETGVSLIHENEIREMPYDEQILIIDRARPIRCKKLYYKTDKRYAGKYGINPLEDRE